MNNLQTIAGLILIAPFYVVSLTIIPFVFKHADFKSNNPFYGEI